MSIKISVFSLYKKILENYFSKNRFVIFKRPYEQKIYFYSHNEDNNYGEKKFFLIQDFYQNYTIKIKPKKIFFIEIKKKQYNFLSKNIIHQNVFLNESIKYKNLLDKAIQNIKKGFFKKVVVSRQIKISLKRFFLKESFQRLIYSYPNTFISIWYDLYHGFWIGSTPELLMKYNHKKLRIDALAGTMWNPYSVWTKKEIIEHQIVVKYIVHLLKKYYYGTFFLEKMKIIKLGFIKHLKTTIHFSFIKEHYNFYEILNRLYPTPSICGYPKIKSLDFIKKNEGYQRDFYTGIIGFVHKSNVELYLNLRCAKIQNKQIILYAGSGITIHSHSYDEYLETEKKITSILSKLIFI
ncbi:chorismate-binding protein [Blattabacterium cuenoti]|uniref:chorismate-binding protein n=1 Tax=Blattabacterium cuenoti TaxID=1653831 RepID=UPI00163CF4E5|nr:chorismate-binding protein [Blattabacterium cuenoti]